jgi:hypothetical protein
MAADYIVQRRHARDGATSPPLARRGPAVDAYRGPFPLAAASIVVWLLAARPWLVRQRRAEARTPAAGAADERAPARS